MVEFIWLVLIVCAFFAGRYQREKDFLSQLESERRMTLWWKDLYERARNAPRPEHYDPYKESMGKIR